MLERLEQFFFCTITVYSNYNMYTIFNTCSMGEHLIWVGYTISYPTRVYGIVELLNNGVGTY